MFAARSILASPTVCVVMKRTFVSVGVALVSAARCFSAALVDDPRTFPVLIAHDKGMGSGCFLRMSNSVYLITAKHVFFAEPEGTNAPALLSPIAVAKSYSRAGTTNVSVRTLAIGLGQLLSAGEVRFSTNRDVAIVRIEECSSNDVNIVSPLPGITFLSPDKGLQLYGPEFTCAAKDVDVGAEVFMFGYPTSLTGPISKVFDPSEPLLRKGIVAGINLARNTIIIDCPSYFGNSGGPVIQVDHPSLGETRFRIIGLVRGFVPFQEEWENKTMKYSHVIKSNSGYTVVEPIDIALALVWK
jgi:Trypsin-like peptidase domain